MPDRMQLRHIAIRSEDPDQLSSFYQKAFGLTVVRRNPRHQEQYLHD
jgi:catechol 2,3-dioxygenase-like lactoylglutathione lyase family enzyme